MTGWSRRLAAACLLLGVPTAAAAACNVSPQGVNFGNYDPLEHSALDGVGNVNVSCDVPTSFTVSLGTGYGTVEDRRMIGTPSQLSYNLYTDVSRLMIWGDGGVSSNGTSVDLTVYGRIPGSQNVRPNVYADSVTVTVAF